MKRNEWRDFIWTTKEHQLPELKQIFEEMWRYYDLYLKQAKDLPYWSTEMDLVGKLAMSAARKNYSSALEFYPEEFERKSKKGRADLWLFFASRENLIVEAKRDENISIKSDLETIAGNAGWYLSDADKQLDRYLKELKVKPAWRASLYFAQIYISKIDMEKNYPEMVQDLLRKCNHIAKQPKNKISFLAHYFLSNKNQFEKKYFEKANSYYPGLIIFGRIKATKK